MKYCAYHTHSTFSDGKNTMEEMVLAAIEAGMPVLGLSDHSDSPYQEYCMRKEQYPEYLAEIERLQKKYAGQIVLLKGIELDSNSDPAITEALTMHCPYSRTALIGSMVEIFMASSGTISMFW